MPTLTDPRLADPQLLYLAAKRAAWKKQQATPSCGTPPAWHAAVQARLRIPHAEQLRFITSSAKRKVIRAGRRGGKTVGMALDAVQKFLRGRRVLYAVPTQDQVDRFWFEVKRALEPVIDQGIVYKNETRHLLEMPHSETRIRAKTAWNADTLRGDYADDLILDEYQLMSEDAWGLVGAPMLLDNNGDATFIYTPPSVLSIAQSKARDKRHAAKLYKAAEQDTSGRWATFHFTSHANPHLSTEALDDITGDMSDLAYRQEILAEDTEDVPGALWTHVLLDRTRVTQAQCPDLVRIGVALDPSATSQATSDEMGIVAGGLGTNGHGYTLRDASLRGTPAICAREAIVLYDILDADVMVAEVNNGGEWIGTVIQFVADEMVRQGERVNKRVNYKMVHATRGKQTRAQPIATEFEHNRIHHVGVFPELEDEQCFWVPGMASPNRMDACLVGGTRITTRRGSMPIESVTCADHVWTRRGWRRVLASQMTNRAAPLVTVSFSNGTQLCGTGNHPVFVEGKGFCPLDSLVWEDIIVTCNDVKPWSSMASPIRDGLMPLVENAASTFVPLVAAAVASTIAMSGLQSLVRSRQGIISIIRTIIHSITPWTGRVDQSRHPQPARVGVVSSSHGGVAPVYNLTVDNQPEYFANGILVHNCVWLYSELLLEQKKTAGVWGR